MANGKQVEILLRDVREWNVLVRERGLEGSRYPDLEGADLHGANLRGANLYGADLAGANLREAVLSKSDLSYACLVKTDLQNAQLESTDLHGAELNGANLRQANFSRASCRLADLKSADLREARLHLANFSYSRLAQTNLEGATLDEADFSETNLEEARLSRASLRNVRLLSANLSSASLYECDLYMANLTRARLKGTRFKRAVCNETAFVDVDLSASIDLDRCDHRGPSVVDQRTFAKSGRLPLTFLRGCGFSDSFIEYLPSLVSEPIQFYSCFISYSTKDQNFADRLYADLQSNGVRCWFAPHDMQGGKKLHEQIDEAIRVYERLLLILSPASMDSEWVKTEIAKARRREQLEGRRMLFPIRLVDMDMLRRWECFDSDTGKDSAREIREFYVPDFSEWKHHDEYQQEFLKLLKGLRAQSK